ncbi:hypothetical protein P3T73_09125 [Kiritimatiellota bacterium B12222]|nr:hypothetical protein P3T73_09125 [Kiritimatiellota bacterium B12222]
MKKILFSLALAFAATSVVQAQEAVYSNVVGMVKKTLMAEKFIFVQYPFIFEDDATPSVEDLLPDVAVGTIVYFWDSGIQEYKTVQKLTPSFWNPPNQNVVRGIGFYVVLPAGATDQDLVLSGEVPDDTEYPETILTLQPGFNAVGNPYPTEITIENSGIQDATNPGDQVAFWDPEQSNFVFVQKLTPTFWNPPNVTIPVGSAVFLQVATGVDIVSTPNYSLTND